MKKWTALLLTLALALSATSAMAAGKLTVNQETYVAAEGYSLKSYIFAEVENTGDKNIAFNDCLLEILNADGDPTDNETIYRMYPEILPAKRATSLITPTPATLPPSTTSRTTLWPLPASPPRTRLPCVWKLRRNTAWPSPPGTARLPLCA